MITEKDIESLARLSKLRLGDEEKREFAAELTDIVAFANKINENVDCDLFEGEREIATDYDLLREDEVKPSFPEEEILSDADAENGYFLVRRNSTK